MHRRIRPYAQLSSLAAFQTEAVEFEEDAKAVDLNSEALRTLQTTTALGADPATAYTVAFWVKPDIATASDWALDMGGVNGNHNRLYLSTPITSITQLVMGLQDGGGTLRKDYRYNFGWLDRLWNLLVVTYVHSTETLQLYRDGVLLTADSTPQDQTGYSMTADDWYKISIGTTLGGAGAAKLEGVHSLAIWDEALTSGEINAIYNSGNGQGFDLASDSGGYTSSTNLVRWFRIGKDATDIGIDSVDGDVDLMDNDIGVTSGDIVDDAPDGGFQWDVKSVDLNGSNEGLITNQTSTKLGHNNEFTAMLWVKPSGWGGGDFLFDMSDISVGQNRMWMQSKSTASGDLQVMVHNSAGTQRKQYDADGAITPNDWQQFVVTFDGSVGSGELFVYRNGVEQVTTKNTDLSCTQDDEVYEVGIGIAHINFGHFAGVYHSAALWDEALTSGEVNAIYNSGNGRDFDLAADSGSYSSSANLTRWWRLGRDKGDIGRDYVDGDVDVMDNATNVTDADVVDEAPT